MIAKISRGWRPGGLLRYLMGPGRFNEHIGQRVIATWDGAPEMHQPVEVGPGEFDVTDLAEDLAMAAVLAGVTLEEPSREAGRKVPRGPVWHCSLRNHAEDRVLTDEEWNEVVVDLLDRTGIAPREDPDACRWVAVRHAPDHVHVAAVLVRQDTGRRVHPRNDFYRARETCRAAELRLGLRPTSAADRTAVEPATRAELEKAARRGAGESSRDWLRRAARVAAVQARDPEEFFRRLADLGVLCRPREWPPGQLVGYALAAPGDDNAQGLPVWFSGRRLARDLALPKLLDRWRSAPAPPAVVAPAAGERSLVGRGERKQALAEAGAAVTAAAAAVRGGDGPTVHAVAHAAGDLFTGFGVVASASYPPAPWEPADVFDRATRSPGVVQPLRWPPVAEALRSAAWRLTAVRSLTSRDSDGAAQLVLALAVLAVEIAAWNEQQRHLGAAAAADRTAALLHAGPAGQRVTVRAPLVPTPPVRRPARGVPARGAPPPVGRSGEPRDDRSRSEVRPGRRPHR